MCFYQIIFYTRCCGVFDTVELCSSNDVSCFGGHAVVCARSLRDKTTTELFLFDLQSNVAETCHVMWLRDERIRWFVDSGITKVRRVVRLIPTIRPVPLTYHLTTNSRRQPLLLHSHIDRATESRWPKVLYASFPSVSFCWSLQLSRGRTTRCGAVILQCAIIYRPQTRSILARLLV